ncbi:DUF4116 domain-containing protein [Aquirufa lenticrescens]
METGRPNLTLQEELFASIKQAFPDAVAKKINKDNFLDIYLPSVSEGKGAHLFFNTVKGAIKIGYYTRDEDFIAQVSSRAPQQIDAASNGLRIVGNPKFEDLEAAVSAALAFLSAIVQGPTAAKGNANFSTELDLDFNVIDAFIAEHGLDLFSGALENYYVNDEIVVLTIGKGDLIAVIAGTADAWDCVQLLGSVDLNDWTGLAELVGKKEANWAKKEFKEENPSKIVLLYCDGKYVYALSSPQEEDLSEEWEEESSTEEEEFELEDFDTEEETDEEEDEEENEEEDEEAEDEEDADAEEDDIIRNTHPVGHYSDLEKLIEIIKEDSKQIHFAHESLLKSESNLKALILANPEIFELLPEKFTSSKSIRKVAIENGFLDVNFLEVIDINDQALLKKVVSTNSNYYRYLPNDYKTKELTYIAIENQSADISFDHLPVVLQNDPSFFKELMTYLNTHLSYKPIPGYSYCDSLLQGYKKWILDDEEVLIQNSLLAYVSKRLIKDENFCFNYLKTNKESYGYLLEKNEALEDNEAFARLAVELDGARNYPDLPDRFKHDREFLALALKSADGNLMLKQLPNEILLVDGKIDFDLVAELIHGNSHNITTIPIPMMEREGVSEKLIFAAKEKNNVLYYAPASLKKDKVFLSKLTDANPFTIAFADKSILADREFMRGILLRLPIAIKFCSEGLKSDKELIKEVVSLNGLVIRYLDEKIVSDPEIYWTALRQNPEAYKLLPLDIYNDKTVKDYISKLNGGIFTFYSSTPYSKDIRFNAILNSADGAFKEELEIFRSIKEIYSPQEVLEAITLDSTQVVFLPEEFFSKNLEVARAILEITFYPLRHKSYRKILGEQELKKQLKAHPWAFRFLEADESLSEEFVKEVLAINGNLLQYLSEEQKKDNAFIRIALTANPEACTFISKEYDWKSKEAKAIGKQILTIDPLLFSYFIERDPVSIYEYFGHAYALDASVLEMMDHSYFEDAWYFISNTNGSFPLDEDTLLHGLNQNGNVYYWEPISNNADNVCLAIENGVEFDWEDLFTTWEQDLAILERAFTYSPSEFTYQALKKALGKKFDENSYVTPQVVAKGSELYPLLSNKLKQNREMAFAYLKSNNFYDLATKFENLPTTFKNDNAFLKMLLEIKIDFEILDGFFDSKLLQEESFIIPYLSLNFEQYSYLPEKLQKNRNIALQYGVYNSSEEYYGLTDLELPSTLGHDKELILEIAKRNKFRKFKIDDALLNDTKFLFEVIEFQPQLVQAFEEENRNPDLLYKLIERNLDVFDYLEDEEKLNPKFFNLVAIKDPSKIRKIEWSYSLADILKEHAENLSIRNYISLFEESDFAEALAEKYAFESVTINPQEKNETFRGTQYYISEPGEIILGYNRNCYLSEEVAGEIPEETLLEFLEGDDSWSNFIWYKSWHDFNSVYYSYGMGEPATDMKLPNGSIEEISLTYDYPLVNNEEECFTNTEKGSFVHIASSNEKAYGWGKWKTYSMAVMPGVFDVANISVEFEGDIVSSYRYKLPEGPYDYFEESQDYETTGQGFSSTLYFNNGKELIDMDELRDLLEENEVDMKDIKAIKKFLLTYNL